MKTNDNSYNKTNRGPQARSLRNPQKREGDRRAPFRNIVKNSDFDQLIAGIRRVTRVTAGGKHMSFSVTMLLGNNKGKIGIGTAKGDDVPRAIDKAKKEAMRHMITVPIVNNTVPYEVEAKYCSSRVLVKPAKEGKGVIAGGVVRDIMILAGIKNVTCKILSRSHSAINNGKATLLALEKIAEINAMEQEKKNNKAQEAKVEEVKVEEKTSNKES